MIDAVVDSVVSCPLTLIDAKSPDGYSPKCGGGMDRSDDSRRKKAEDVGQFADPQPYQKRSVSWRRCRMAHPHERLWPRG